MAEHCVKANKCLITSLHTGTHLIMQLASLLHELEDMLQAMLPLYTPRQQPLQLARNTLLQVRLSTVQWMHPSATWQGQQEWCWCGGHDGNVEEAVRRVLGKWAAGNRLSNILLLIKLQINGFHEDWKQYMCNRLAAPFLMGVGPVFVVELFCSVFLKGKMQKGWKCKEAIGFCYPIDL